MQGYITEDEYMALQNGSPGRQEHRLHNMSHSYGFRSTPKNGHITLMMSSTVQERRTAQDPGILQRQEWGA